MYVNLVTHVNNIYIYFFWDVHTWRNKIQKPNVPDRTCDRPNRNLPYFIILSPRLNIFLYFSHIFNLSIKDPTVRILYVSFLRLLLNSLNLYGPNLIIWIITPTNAKVLSCQILYETHTNFNPFVPSTWEPTTVMSTTGRKWSLVQMGWEEKTRGCEKLKKRMQM